MIFYATHVLPLRTTYIPWIPRAHPVLLPKSSSSLCIGQPSSRLCILRKHKFQVLPFCIGLKLWDIFDVFSRRVRLDPTSSAVHPAPKLRHQGVKFSHQHPLTHINTRVRTHTGLGLWLVVKGRFRATMILGSLHESKNCSTTNYQTNLSTIYYSTQLVQQVCVRHTRIVLKYIYCTYCILTAKLPQIPISPYSYPASRTRPAVRHAISNQTAC